MWVCVCMCDCVGIHCFVFGWSVAQEVSEMVVWKRDKEQKKKIRKRSLYYIPDSL